MNMKIAAVCIFYTPYGEILFLQRRASDRTVSGFCLPGGKVDLENESLLDGLIREIKEETGYSCKNTNLVKSTSFVAQNKTKVEVYKYKLTEMFLPKLSHEHQGFAWVVDYRMLKLAGNTLMGLSEIKSIPLYTQDFVFPTQSKYAGKTMEYVVKVDHGYLRYWIGDSFVERDLEQTIKKAENPPKTITYGDDESYVPYVREPINPNACPCGRNQGYCASCDVCDGYFSDNQGFSIS